jgi:hypothetical protein
MEVESGGAIPVLPVVADEGATTATDEYGGGNGSCLRSAERWVDLLLRRGSLWEASFNPSFRSEGVVAVVHGCWVAGVVVLRPSLVVVAIVVATDPTSGRRIAFDDDDDDDPPHAPASQQSNMMISAVDFPGGGIWVDIPADIPVVVVPAAT